MMFKEMHVYSIRFPSFQHGTLTRLPKAIRSKVLAKEHFWANVTSMFADFAVSWPCFMMFKWNLSNMNRMNRDVTLSLFKIAMENDRTSMNIPMFNS